MIWLLVVVFGSVVLGLGVLVFASVVVETRNRRRHARRRVSDYTRLPDEHGFAERPAGRRP